MSLNQFVPIDCFPNQEHLEKKANDCEKNVVGATTWRMFIPLRLFLKRKISRSKNKIVPQTSCLMKRNELRCPNDNFNSRMFRRMFKIFHLDSGIWNFIRSIATWLWSVKTATGIQWLLNTLNRKRIHVIYITTKCLRAWFSASPCILAAIIGKNLNLPQKEKVFSSLFTIRACSETFVNLRFHTRKKRLWTKNIKTRFSLHRAHSNVSDFPRMLWWLNHLSGFPKLSINGIAYWAVDDILLRFNSSHERKSL